MRLFPRSKWTAHCPIRSREQFYPAPVGIQFYGAEELDNFQDKDPENLLENFRKQATLTGWNDIDFNLAIAGNVDGIWNCQGLTVDLQIGQNVIVILLVGSAEKPTDTLLRNMLTCRDFIQSKYGELPVGVQVNAYVDHLASKKDFWSGGLVPYKPTPEIIEVPLLGIESPVHVFDLQTQLAYWGYYTALIDGVYGPLTTHAVELLQKNLLLGNIYRYDISGVYDEHTQRAWERYARSFTA